jgi:hypothetical protein
MSALSCTITTVVLVSDFAHVSGGSSKVAIESAIGLLNAGYAS